MRVQFYTHLAHVPSYGQRLLAKALAQSGLRVFVYGGQGQSAATTVALLRDTGLRVWPLLRWPDVQGLSATELAATVRLSRLIVLDDCDAQAIAAIQQHSPENQSRIWLNWACAQTQAAPILQQAQALQCDRLLELVDRSGEALAAARQRWRFYEQAACTVEHVVKQEESV